MTRRALLVGSQTYGLAGCNGDVELMKGGLERQGFDTIDVRIEQDASRAGIIDGYKALIAATAPGDAVVVYYSGHGGRNTRTDFAAQEASGGSPFYQYLVPFDMEESEVEDFRGLLSEELSALQTQLTLRFLNAGATPNLTTILDCCHSGYMSRDPGAPAAKGLTEEQSKQFSLVGISQQVAQLPPDDAPWKGTTNPYAVRLAACQVDQSAFERDSARGGRHGVLTDALVELLDGLGGTSMPWAAAGEILRHRVQAFIPGQRPVVEGPADLSVFSTDATYTNGSLPVSTGGGRSVIEGAGLLGVAVGDRFDLQPPTEEHTIAHAEVTAVVGGSAQLNVELIPGITVVPEGARAVPTSTHRPRRSVASRLTGDVAEAVDTALAASVVLAPAEEGGAAPAPVFATVVDEGGLVVLDSAGARARTHAEATDAAGVERVIGLLELLAKARRLVELESGTGDAELTAAVEVSFARLDGATRTELNRFGEQIRAGDRLSVKLTNRSDQPLFAWLFDVGVSGRVGLVTNGHPDGRPLAAQGQAGDSFTVWEDQGGATSWPSDVPGDGSAGSALRPETFVLLVADRSQSLGGLETPRDTARGESPSSLDVILDEVRGGTREVPPASSEPSLRYRVETIQFLLSPA